MRAIPLKCDKITKLVSEKALLAGLSPLEKFLFSIVILFILGLAFQFLGAFLAAWIYGFGVTEVLNLTTFEDQEYVAATKLIQLVGAIGTFIVPAFLFSYLFAGDLFSYYRFGESVQGISILLTILMIFSIIPFINYLAEVNLRMEFPLSGVDRILRDLEGQAEELLNAFTSTRNMTDLLVNLLIIGVIAAVGEELIFRGLIQRLIQEMLRNAHMAILITAVFFSAFHFQFFSFLPRFLLGLILGYLMYYGRSIWYPITAHFVNNAMGVIYFHFNEGERGDMLEDIGTSAMMPLAAVLSLLGFLILFGLWLYYTAGPGVSRSRPFGRARRE